LESQTIADLNVQQTVIATGGSAIYGETAMRHFALMGHIVYLRCPLSVLDQRIGDMNARGIAAPPGQGLNEVEAERVPLYEQYADATLDVGTQSMEDALDQLLTLIKAR
jgi:shikimate kinase